MCLSCEDAVTRAYFAGLVDGEGYIGIRTVHYTHTNSTSLSLQITITNAVRLPLDEAADRWGGGVHSTERRPGRPVFRWYVPARAAAAFLREVSPYLRIKREQAEIALELQKSIDACQGLVTPAEWTRRQEMQVQIRALNQRKYYGQYLVAAAPGRA